MIFGIVLIFFVQWLFLGNLRSALIVATTIPFALFFAITMLVLRGKSANLLSVGAIDFGLVVDATVIMVENIFRRLSQPPGTAICPLSDPGARPPDRRVPRQIRDDRQRGDRGEPGDLLFGGDHRRRFCAAVHDVGRRRPHFRADGEDLRLCHCRRTDRDLYRNSGVERDAAARAGQRGRDPADARLAPPLPAGSRLRAGESDRDTRRRACCCWRWRGSRCRSWASSSCPSSKKEISGFARRCRRRSRSRRRTATSTGCAG